jgi:hypothetical protein
MPYVLVNVDEQQFADVQSSFTGHSVVKHVGELSPPALDCTAHKLTISQRRTSRCEPSRDIKEGGCRTCRQRKQRRCMVVPVFVPGFGYRLKQPTD